MLWKPNFGDKALSDVIGTVLLLGVTVSLVVVAATSFYELSATSREGEAPELDILATLDGTRRNISLLHTGGDSFDPADLRVLVDANQSKVYDAPLVITPGTTWRVGDRLTVTLATPIAPGSHVEIAIVGHSGVGILAGASLDLPLTSVVVTPPGFTVAAFFRDSTNLAVINTSTTLHLYAAVSHPLGRKHVRYVVADLGQVKGSTWYQLSDDGTNDDAVAGDGIYTRPFIVPSYITLGVKTINITAYDFSGAIVQSSTAVIVVRSLSASETPAYNTTVFRKVAWWMNKTAKVDTVSVKMRAEVKETVKNGGVIINGRAYYPRFATLHYVPHKPGGTGGVSDSVNVCAAATTKTLTPEFTFPALTIPNYDSSRSLLQYYLVMTMQTKDSPTLTRDFTFQTQADSQYFMLKSTQVNRLVESSAGVFNAITPCV